MKLKVKWHPTARKLFPFWTVCFSILQGSRLTFSLFMIKSRLVELDNAIFQTVVTYGFPQDKITRVLGLSQECLGSTENYVCPWTLREQFQLLFASYKQIKVSIIFINSKPPSLSLYQQYFFLKFLEIFFLSVSNF